jgi:urea carboxylase
MTSGYTLTSMLETFSFQPCVIEIINGGLQTTVQDYPGRPNKMSGVPIAGPMDNMSFQSRYTAELALKICYYLMRVHAYIKMIYLVANMLVGNERGVEAFEITLMGPTIIFHQAAVIALCGGDFEFTIDSKPAAMWTRLSVPKGSEVSIGQPRHSGYRAYLAILGGLPNM